MRGWGFTKVSQPHDSPGLVTQELEIESDSPLTLNSEIGSVGFVNVGRNMCFVVLGHRKWPFGRQWLISELKGEQNQPLRIQILDGISRRLFHGVLGVVPTFVKLRYPPLYPDSQLAGILGIHVQPANKGNPMNGSTDIFIIE
jgi:hypothetical protein